MDFFEHQDHARNKTWLLLLIYCLAVTLVTVIASLVVWISAQYLQPLIETQQTHLVINLDLYDLNNVYTQILEEPLVFLGSVLVILLLIIMGTLSKFKELSLGGHAIAKALEGTLVPVDTVKSMEKKLLNIVEEMAIASGVPVPDVYILYKEIQPINAFAAGKKANLAVIGVTLGTLMKLDRDELQGVIAHEFSHIFNGDMRINFYLIGLLNGLLWIYLTGKGLVEAGYLLMGGKDRFTPKEKGYTIMGTQSSHRGSSFGALIAIPGLALMAIGWIGVFFANLIKSGVSRQREFLADASAVQFTRNPSSIAGALQKIMNKGSRLNAVYSLEASHLFYANVLRKSWFKLTATHPSLEERILRIGFIPQKEDPESLSAKVTAAPVPRGLVEVISGFQEDRPLSSFQTEGVLESVGKPSPVHLSFINSLLKELPPLLKESVYTLSSAQALMYLLLINQDAQIRQRQIEDLQELNDSRVLAEFQKLLPELEQIQPEHRIPYIDMALPTLRHMSEAQYQEFKVQLQVLIDADGYVSLFEYTLWYVLSKHLDAVFSPPVKQKRTFTKLASLQYHCEQLLSILAFYGHDKRAVANQSFLSGIHVLAFEMPSQMFPEEECVFYKLGETLDALRALAPQDKKNLLNACMRCIENDGIITIGEAEIFRLIAEGLECPVPPLIPRKSRL
ncbi:M48 family metallopeptidase [Deltaproteobacteria bacterium TL4]